MLGTRAFLTTAVSLVVLGIGSVRAQTPVQLAPVIVTATRTEAAPFDIPASVDRVDGAAFRDGRSQVNLSEGLAGVPGLLARDRQNHAQDVQISVRGFGARSTFGIRGVRLYVDGIPATLPDGQGQITHADLGSVGRVEVLRGPFSALYGNASGGVIQVFTEDGAGPPTVTAGTAAGSDDLRRNQLKFSGAQGGLGYVGDWSRFATDGYRNHSAAARSLGNVKLTLRPDEASRLTLIVNSMSLQAQDPLGLTRAQFEADSRSADAAAIDFDTRKSVDQTQFGLVYERRLDDRHSIRALVYTGERSTQQFQSIPTGPQANPLHPGGVIDLGRRYRGTDLRWTIRGSFADAPYSLIAGLAYDTLDEHRRGYQNFIGSALGVQGALRRDERNTVWNLDPYVQATWRPAPRWSLQAGLRRSSVHFDSADHYVAGSNADDSGHARYGATLPVFGAMYDWSDTVHVYASAGRGFETPTLNELAYRPNGDTGLNFGLRPATSDSLEAGIKARLADRTEATAAVFETRTEREIVTLTNTGGRTTYQNAGATRRRGLELSATQRWARDWRAQAAYTWLDAVYRDAFATCTASPCAAPNLTITAGNRIPGVARSSLSLSLHWAPPLGWRASIEGRYVGRVYVNDANSDAAEGYATAGAGVGYVMRAGAWQLSGYARVENFLDARYVGSVIVNEGNGRYFEPAPGRTWVAGLSGSLSF